MRILVLIVALLVSFPALSQDKDKSPFFKSLYEDVLKYSTFYAAGDYRAPYESSDKKYLIRTPDGAGIYDIPNVVDVTEYFPADYRIGIGIRKLGRFDYERKPGNFWTGDQNLERQNALNSPSSAVDGLEYLFHFEKERRRGEEWTNQRYFVRHTGDWHTVKLETRYQGAYDFNYNTVDVRGRAKIGKKFSLSAGAAFRTHERVYGVNPYEIWVSALNGDGSQANYWYQLAYDYGYTDAYSTTTIDNPVTGEQQNIGGYFWWDPDGNLISSSDLQFRDGPYKRLISRYNEEILGETAEFGLISPVVGFDFYHYKKNFWLHLYGSAYLPYHKYVMGDKDEQGRVPLSYLFRDSWDQYGLADAAKGDQWWDFQGGANFGWRVGKNIGLFADAEYTRMWDSEFFITSFGVNYTFR